MSDNIKVAATTGKAFERLVGIVEELREKCPWDKKQTIESLRYLTIEETYELADAILDNDLQGVKEEIGDLVMHMVFYAIIAQEKEAFDLKGALNQICEKLIFRHPHIYSDGKAETAEEVKKNWEKLKLKEGKQSIFEGVPLSLPAMVKATRLQEKAHQVGFDWDTHEQVWEKVKEELDELHEEVEAGEQTKMEDEFGDLLFALINYARFINIDPESALERTNKKFVKRFHIMESLSKKAGKELADMTLKEMEALWQEAKSV